ncbi:MAG: hypothetical protein V4664_01315, partial [Patescibacteria group bacterium]
VDPRVIALAGLEFFDELKGEEADAAANVEDTISETSTNVDEVDGHSMIYMEQLVTERQQKALTNLTPEKGLWVLSFHV